MKAAYEVSDLYLAIMNLKQFRIVLVPENADGDGPEDGDGLKPSPPPER